MAQVWMHNGFLMVEGEKMSKSLGNFITINELLATEKFGGRKWPGEVLRLAMLKTHYRQPIDWTVRALEEAKANLEDWGRVAALSSDTPPVELLDALSDDLNTAEVIALLHKWRKAGDAQALGAALTFLGLSIWKDEAPSLAPDAAALLDARLAARKAKDFRESDRLRDELLAMGIRVKDGKDPATGEPVTTWEAVR
jgi:cysteinyl-tRNA synthetase